MSCPGERLSAWLDGELEPDEASAVAAHVAACAACADEARALEAVGEVLHEAAVPDPGLAAWAGFERELADGLARRRGPGWRALLVAAGLLLAGLPLLALRGAERAISAAQRLPSTALEVPAPVWAPSGDSPRVPLESVAPVELLRRARLDQSAQERLARDALVQVPSPATRLDELVCGPEDPLLPLATADASLLVSGAVLARAALVVELEHVRPRLLLLARLLESELSRATGEATTPELRRELARLRERFAVALALLGEPPAGLPVEAQERVALEVGRVRAGRGRLPGVVDPTGELIDYRQLRPRGAWADPEVADLARAEAWLALWAPRLEAAHPAELREAALLSALLARGKVPGGRSGIHLQAELEAAFELLSGPPDALTPLDVAAALGDLLGTRTPGPDALAELATLERLGALLRERARARGLPGVRGLGQGDATARFQLLGGRRTLEGWALDRLGAVPGRRASALDLPALLGSRRARAALGALQLDPAGLDERLAALRPAAQACVSPGPFLPARTSLEQARTWSAASLLGRPDRTAIPFQRSAAYVDRLLMAALGGLTGPLAAPDALPGPAAPGPLPVVEPLPHLHARLTFGARRVSVALRELIPGESRRRDRALAQLERLALVEEALRDASLDLLEGRPLRPGSRRGLGLWSAMLRDLGPPDVRQSELIYYLERKDEVRAIQRAVLRLDRLVAIALDAQGRPVLAEGPVVLAAEVISPDAPVHDPAALSALAGPSTPPWATHLVNR